MEISFAPKEVILPQVCRLEVLAADKAEAYGLQIGLKLKIVGGEHDGHTFTDYANRDEDTGQINQASKPGPSSRRAWVGTSTGTQASP
jgi:hypothetical protein